MQKLAREPGLLRAALIGSVLLGFVVALLLAGSPELHELAHGNGGETEHHCLVATMHSGGSDELAPAPPAFSTFLGVIFREEAHGNSEMIGSVFLAGCVFEHAPPVRS